MTEKSTDNGQAGAPNGEIEITSAMVVAGVERMRKSVDEFQQSSADAVVVLGILECALSVRLGGRKSFLTPSAKRKIPTDSLQYL